MRIGILGATSQIAQSIYPYLCKGHEVIRFGRKKHLDYSSFPKYKFEMIINCVGVAKPRDIKKVGKKVLGISKKYDKMCMKYIKKRPGTIYVNLSSGIVLERKNGCYYRLAKQRMEEEHRNKYTYSIIDLRIYSYFSRFIDLDSGFLMSELVKCLKEKKTFYYAGREMLRDYIHPSDLAKLILDLKQSNTCIDVYSKNPIGLSDILRYFIKKGLKCETKEIEESPTGFKAAYYAERQHSYVQPEYTSLETIKEELEYLL